MLLDIVFLSSGINQLKFENKPDIQRLLIYDFELKQTTFIEEKNATVALLMYFVYKTLFEYF